MQFWHHVTSDNKETTHEGVIYEQHKGTNFEFPPEDVYLQHWFRWGGRTVRLRNYRPLTDVQLFETPENMETIMVIMSQKKEMKIT